MESDREPPLFTEVYGYHSEEPISERDERQMETKSGSDIFSSKCPFTEYACTKSTSTDDSLGMTRPLGVCSASNSSGEAVITCPNRFKAETVWTDLKEHLFPDTTHSFHVLEERSLGNTGRVDLIPLVHENGVVKDFAAIEIQASYFTGESIRKEFNQYMDRINDGESPTPPRGSRRMDYRSCIDKRLLPQIEEKIEVTESWDKPLGVIVQKMAFEDANIVQRIEPVDENKATFFWFVYEYTEDDPQYQLRLDQVLPTTYNEIQEAIGASKAPGLDEFLYSLTINWVKN